MRILFVTSEALPYYKSGGLADVSRALPDALLAAGHDVRIVLPLYGAVRNAIGGSNGAGSPANRSRNRAARAVGAGSAAIGDRDAALLNVDCEIDVPWPTAPVQTRFLEHRAGAGATALLVEQPALFEAGSPYEGTTTEPLEVGRRFAFFCRAVVQFALEWKPDVIHLNDWTTGFVPVYALVDGLDSATVFSIHNLAHQGNYSPALLEQAGVPLDMYRTENGVEFMHTASFMKAGIALSDRLLTVSPSHAREIQTREYGTGLDGLLRFRHRVLGGILNGIDTVAWDPAHDAHIAATYSASSLARKDANRDALLEECGLDGDGPVFAMVGRMAWQKGLDIVAAALPDLLDVGVRLVVLGEGDAALLRVLTRASSASPDRIRVYERFDEALARRIYAGADFFLMPSRYEPCGLGQMIAQRYGTPPVVRRTGGLIDTVAEGKTGFVFDDASPEAVIDVVRRAAGIWRATGWTALRRRCMKLDRSWAGSAAQYETVYRLACGADMHGAA